MSGATGCLPAAARTRGGRTRTGIVAPAVVIGTPISVVTAGPDYDRSAAPVAVAVGVTAVGIAAIRITAVAITVGAAIAHTDSCRVMRSVAIARPVIIGATRYSDSDRHQ